MTPLETLQKYNLKTDNASIKERLENFDKLEEIKDAEYKLYAADLALLCERAEMGERLDKQNDELQCELSMLRYDKVQLKQIREIVERWDSDKQYDSNQAMDEIKKVLFEKGEPK